MEISKNGKKIMTFILAMAFVLSGIMYTPKSASAADVPKVTFLGATLRLGQDADNNGKQSMKIGIQINNASKAKSCAINIKVGGKTCTVTTEEIEASKGYTHDKMQTVDVDNDTVIYAVVLTNIPESAFDTNIEIQGTATDINGKEYVSNEEYQTRTVNGIVKSLQEAYPSLGIGMMNGVLIKTEPYASLQFKEGEVISTSGDAGKFKYWLDENANAAATCSLSEDGTYYTVTTEAGSGKGIGYQFPWAEVGKCVCVASMRASGEENVKVAYVNWFAGGFSPIANTPVTALSNEWQEISFTYNGGWCQGDFFTTETGGQSYDIKSYNIYKAITVNDIANSDEFAEELHPGMSIPVLNDTFEEGNYTGWAEGWWHKLSVIDFPERNGKVLYESGRANGYSAIDKSISGDFRAGDTITVRCDVYGKEITKVINAGTENEEEQLQDVRSCVIKYNSGDGDKELPSEGITKEEWKTVEKSFVLEKDTKSIKIMLMIMGSVWDRSPDSYFDNITVIQTAGDAHAAQ